ncbi:hypothetical protein DNU06_01845 [Putridiphycobacter roseus]|uniref:Late embryogenesis abundant protein LEA-2 subgroup domain-containing protein n=1 Tax=Putridiphycobacter roseus TaxID=2219161 RepID=A0A2W1NUZ5_9FLAO|nr:hypothetical protein [Putridiphycobacter roseus]PZE18598.1 hypothetical protein DNU06_01845 [Putridiphycobacter roseus]
MKWYFWLCFNFFITFNSFSSFWYKDLEFLAIENFSVAKGEDKIAISFDYVINNLNWYNITIKPSVLNLNIADTDCGEVLVLDKINIKRKTKGAYKFTLIGETSNFLKSGFSSIWTMLSKGEIDFILKGDLKAGVFGMTKKWKMEYIYKMTWNEFMSFF